MKDEMERLSAEQADAVKKALKLAKGDSGMHKVGTPDGEAYAYATFSALGERIHWGFKATDGDREIARGVKAATVSRGRSS